MKTEPTTEHSRDCHSRAEPALSAVELAEIQTALMGTWTPAFAGVTKGQTRDSRVCTARHEQKTVGMARPTLWEIET